MALCDFFFNALKIDCFIKESKYPNNCYNNFLVPFAGDNIFFYQKIAKICKVIRTLLFVADLLFKRPLCDEVPILLFIALPGIQRKSTKRVRYC